MTLANVSFWTILTVVNYAVVIVAIGAVLLRPREPRAMVAWVLLLLLAPVIGLVLYALMGDLKIARTRRRRRRRRERMGPSIAAAVTKAMHPSESDQPPDEGLLNLLNLATRLSRHAPTVGNEVTIYHDAEQTFLSLQLAIESAQSHIHLEYYIFQPDETGAAIRDLLVRKSRAGVKVRLLLDYVGCWTLGRKFLGPMREAGIEVAFFLRVVPWRGRWHVNLRNHRKIVVVDGRVGFTGSQNIGNEYLGRIRRKVGQFRDTHMRIIGPAVLQLQEIFVEDWHFTTQQDLLTDDHFPAPSREGEHVVQVIPSGPDDDGYVMHHVLLAAVAAAKKSVSIITPYFVPDIAMRMALESLAYRGIRVSLIVPTRTDQRFVLWAGRSYYNELFATGVEILEYDDVMLHSKVMIVDDSWAMVGSANMDERSFRLNFEVTTLLFDSRLAVFLAKDFERLKSRSRRFIAKHNRWRFHQSLLLGVARMASPLL